MEITTTVRAAIAITEELLRTEVFGSGNLRNFNFKVEPRSELIHDPHPLYHSSYRIFEVEVRLGKMLAAQLMITLLSQSHPGSIVVWRFADITVKFADNMYCSHHFKAKNSPEGWKIRRVARICYSDHDGTTRWDNEFYFDRIPDELKHPVTPA